MEKHWYFSLAGRVEGPFTQAQLIARISDEPNALVWNPNLVKWQASAEAFSSEHVSQTKLEATLNARASDQVPISDANRVNSCESELLEQTDQASSSQRAGPSTVELAAELSAQKRFEQRAATILEQAKRNQQRSKKNKHQSRARGLSSQARQSSHYYEFLMAKELRVFAEKMLRLEIKQAKQKQALLKELVMSQHKKMVIAKKRLEQNLRKQKLANNEAAQTNSEMGKSTKPMSSHKTDQWQAIDTLKAGDTVTIADSPNESNQATITHFQLHSQPLQFDAHEADSTDEDSSSNNDLLVGQSSSEPSNELSSELRTPRRKKRLFRL